MKAGIEELYAKIADWFSVLEGYMDDKNIGAVFRMCRLKPYDLAGSKSKFSDRWIDEFGSSVRIEDKKLRVVRHDLSIDKQIRTTDLYGGLSISKTAKISNMAYISKDMLAFLGIDGYLRAFVLVDVWRKCSPLLIGFDILKVIVDNADISYACEKEGYWLTVMPVSKKLIDEFGLKEIIDG